MADNKSIELKGELGGDNQMQQRQIPPSAQQQLPASPGGTDHAKAAEEDDDDDEAEPSDYDEATDEELGQDDDEDATPMSTSGSGRDHAKEKDERTTEANREGARGGAWATTAGHNQGWDNEEVVEKGVIEKITKTNTTKRTTRRRSRPAGGRPSGATDGRKGNSAEADVEEGKAATAGNDGGAEYEEVVEEIGPVETTIRIIEQRTTTRDRSRSAQSRHSGNTLERRRSRERR